MNHQRDSDSQRQWMPPGFGSASTEPARLVRGFVAALLCLLGVVVVSGCTSTKITDREQLAKGEQLPRPNHILVYDFAATPAEVPADSALAQNFQLESQTQTEEQIETGRKLGAQIAAKLVEDIREMGMPATHAATRAVPELNDLVLRGYLVSVEPGSAAKRLTIGFGAGGSELTAAAEGLQMTAQGLRKLGSGTVQAGGRGKTPGTAVGAATFAATANPVGLIVTSGMKVYGEVSGRGKIEARAEEIAEAIANVIRERFREQGWID